MKSPFPGMDPYLEESGLWPDFHLSFITYCRDQLVDRLPESYDIRMEERIALVEAHWEPPKLMRPDLAVSRDAKLASSRADRGSATLVDIEPTTIPLAIIEETTESSIHILHGEDRSLVTVIELLSPSNKVSGDNVYSAKRNAILGQSVHLVELDLLVSGKRLPVRRPLPVGHYYAVIARAERRPNADVFAWTIRQPFPKIPIPLKAPDPDVILDLAAVFDLAYERGRYGRKLDYSKELTLPFGREEIEWAGQRARAG